MSSGSLRVIGGAAKGRKLRTPPGETTRPVTDLVKEALFNILGPDIQGASLLDLFGGSGAIGIEALSRGAEWVTFNELNRLPVETIKANLQTTGFTAQAEVLRGDAFTLLEAAPRRAYDYVYIAPPQYKGLWKRALLLLDAHSDWLTEDGWVIVQIHPLEFEQDGGSGELKQLVEFERRKYGSTLLVFYEKQAHNMMG